MLDSCDPKTTLKSGDLVTVRNLHGCPKANTMGHCYVYKDGKFMGMVCCNSLHTKKDWETYLESNKV